MRLLAVPLWVPLVLVAAPTACAWHRCRRHAPGHCPTCGYDLVGIAAGVCPECGTAVRRSAETKPDRLPRTSLPCEQTPEHPSWYLLSVPCSRQLRRPPALSCRNAWGHTW